MKNIYRHIIRRNKQIVELHLSQMGQNQTGFSGFTSIKGEENLYN
jgi:hypothetical protein